MLENKQICYYQVKFTQSQKLHVIVIVLLLANISKFLKLTWNAGKPTFSNYAKKAKESIGAIETDCIYGSFVSYQTRIESRQPSN